LASRNFPRYRRSGNLRGSMTTNKQRRTRTKICGITRVEDGLAAASAGADAIGLVFHGASPRNVAVAQAAAICVALPPFVTTVGLFVDAAAETVNDVLRQVPLDLLQFHGDESAEYCRAFSRPYIKAIRMADDVDLHALAAEYRDARGLLLDAFHPGIPGGTGQTFDWERIPQTLAAPVILAGGLAPDNVADAVRSVHPYAVDVSSGVEAAKGIKDAAKIEAFIRGVNSADGD
jgi:phosphoribosylanthranilate isomerase